MVILLIQFIHLLLVILLISSIFLPYLFIKQASLSLLILFLIQYLTGYQRCGLTEIEYILKGEDYKEGFIYRVVNPLITVPENYFNYYMWSIHIFWIIILFIQTNFLLI
jgi:hypothetical protein